MEVRKIPNLNHDKKKHVAAYCRVSTNKEEQEESYERQVSYYENFIRCNPQWEFAGIYADKGHSGTSVRHRTEFQRLMSDALGKAWGNGKTKTAPANINADSTQERKIDIILVKSISRFARNLVDCDRAIKELKAAGVEVRFEKEHISSFDPSTGFVLSLLAAVAQDESRSISENVRWTYANRFKNGEYNLGNNRIFGYDSVDGKLVPNGDAEIVKSIFDMYAAGTSLSAIVKMLNADDVHRMRSVQKVNASMIQYILKNETYVGDKYLQKQPPTNFLTKKPDANAEHISYYLTDDHPAIIDRETWEKVQARIEKSKHTEQNGTDTTLFPHGQQHPLYGRLFCGLCGAPYKRRTLHECHACGGGTYKAWNCRERQKGQQGNGCKNRTIREEWLMDELEKMKDDGKEKIYVYEDRIEIR